VTGAPELKPEQHECLRAVEREAERNPLEPSRGSVILQVPPEIRFDNVEHGQLNRFQIRV
jgi:hypothetical protein